MRCPLQRQRVLLRPARPVSRAPVSAPARRWPSSRRRSSSASAPRPLGLGRRRAGRAAARRLAPRLGAAALLAGGAQVDDLGHLRVAAPRRCRTGRGRRSGSRGRTSCCRCSLEPWVKLSGTTQPWLARCSASSPIRAAVSSALRMSSSVSCSRSCDRVGPDAGVAVGLQLDRGPRARSTARSPTAAALGVDLGEQAELVLHVVADLVGDHVGAWRTRRASRAAAPSPGRSRCRDRPSGRSGSRTAPSPTGRSRRPTRSRR